MEAKDRDRIHRCTVPELVTIIQEAPGLREQEWFKWYPLKWLSEYRLHKVSLAVKGAYFNLLNVAWMQPDCGLPSDQEELREMAEATSEEWREVCHIVTNLFAQFDGKLYSKRLLLCRAETIITSKNRSKSASSRWSKRAGKAKKHANALQMHNFAMQSDATSLSSSMSSSMSGSEKKGESEGEDIPYREIVDHLNQKTASNYKDRTPDTRKHIHARWSEGHRLDDFKLVVDHRVLLWSENKDMVQYLRPSTLFGTKFEGYLQAARLAKPRIEREQEEKQQNDTTRRYLEEAERKLREVREEGRALRGERPSPVLVQRRESEEEMPGRSRRFLSGAGEPARIGDKLGNPGGRAVVDAEL